MPAAGAASKVQAQAESYYFPPLISPLPTACP